MAIPTLAAMSALTLLQNPHMQPEDVAVNYGDLNTYASRIQRYRRRRSRALSKINAVMRGYLSRANTLLGKLGRYVPGSRLYGASQRGRRIGRPWFDMLFEGEHGAFPFAGRLMLMGRQHNISTARRDYRRGIVWYNSNPGIGRWQYQH